MPIKLNVPASAAGLMAIALAGCATQQPSSSTQGSTVVQFGEVADVRDLTVSGGRTSGAGSLAGSVLGAIAGSNVGGGYGRTAAAVGGAVAGGAAGQHVERSGATSKVTELTVRFPDGGVSTYNVDPKEAFRVGDKVTVTTSQGATRVTR
ncbi:MAG: outer rane lipoprotein SlyB [Burkholderiales bacterium]|jgi:outer membrane lipoprotein SlyB